MAFTFTFRRFLSHIPSKINSKQLFASKVFKRSCVGLGLCCSGYLVFNFGRKHSSQSPPQPRSQSPIRPRTYCRDSFSDEEFEDLYERHPGCAPLINRTIKLQKEVDSFSLPSDAIPVRIKNNVSLTSLNQIIQQISAKDPNDITPPNSGEEGHFDGSCTFGEEAIKFALISRRAPLQHYTAFHNGCPVCCDMIGFDVLCDPR
eukprot:442550_1